MSNYSAVTASPVTVSHRVIVAFSMSAYTLRTLRCFCL